MKSVSVSGSDTDALKLLIIVELSTTDDALIEADVIYDDGTEKIEYYKIKTGTHYMSLLDIYKQVE